jgi:hypothetical protein
VQTSQARDREKAVMMLLLQSRKHQIETSWIAC